MAKFWLTVIMSSTHTCMVTISSFAGAHINVPRVRVAGSSQLRFVTMNFD